MRKIFIAFYLVLFSGDAFAAHPGVYVRKQVQPDFFIPQKELSRQEVLPPFRPRQSSGGASQISKEEEIPLVSHEGEVSAEEKVVAAPVEETVKQFSMTVPEKSPYLDYDFSNLQNVPEYKQKYDDYLADLSVIAQTGSAPENQRLNEDLAAMNSDERFAIAGDAPRRRERPRR